MAEVGRPGNQSFPELAATWLPPEELRRLAAYKVLLAYDNNQAGQLAAASGDEAGIERRELGDAAKLVDTALGYLLGSEQKVTVEGAEHAEGEVPKPGATEAAGLQEWLRTWADKELLTLRIQQAERAAVLLGDSVYVLAWNPEKQRPTLRVYDPGFFFPQWDDEDADFPSRVHLAWELPEDREAGLKARVRRVTYELGSRFRGRREPGAAVPVEPWASVEDDVLPDGRGVVAGGHQAGADAGPAADGQGQFPGAAGRHGAGPAGSDDRLLAGHTHHEHDS
ncbi:toprim domain-containing protein [Streptomyces violaceusniger]|uniref:toprim domain-containing protein n=1 Tax=Streptomyces violaceusniger TaxID=68280 RepID=UPI001237577C|nr:toprim domain-containing protein [Streptomyces violaceusniger]